MRAKDSIALILDRLVQAVHKRLGLASIIPTKRRDKETWRKGLKSELSFSSSVLSRGSESSFD